jgi:hypothetical protein
MSSLPNFQTSLLTAVSLFKSPQWQSSQRDRFKNGDLRFEAGLEKMHDLLEVLRTTLAVDHTSAAWNDAVPHIMQLGTHWDSVSLGARTYNATPQNTLWMFLSHDVMPSLGRAWGFWSIEESIIPDTLGGPLWFLPQPDAYNPDRLVLPVQTVARWWLGLLDCSQEEIWPDATDDRLRTFQNWLGGHTTAETAKIAEWFPDDAHFDYRAKNGDHPNIHTVRNMFLWARALEDGYKQLVDFLTPGIDPRDTDPQVNKVLQLLELFRLAHDFTAETNDFDAIKADRDFISLVPHRLADGPFFSIIASAKQMLEGPQDFADVLSNRFKHMSGAVTCPDVFTDHEMSTPMIHTADVGAVSERDEISECLTATLATWLSDTPNRNGVVSNALIALRRMPRHEEFAADIMYLDALHSLSQGDFKAAEEKLTLGLDLCKETSFGPVYHKIAEASFGLSVAQKALDQNRCERAFRTILRSVSREYLDRWMLGQVPFKHSIRLAAADHSEHFWPDLVRPYPSIELAQPLDQHSEIFKTFFGLMWQGADETEVKLFIRQNKAELKRKLHDVRGDTFVTVVTKMVADFVSRIDQMSSDQPDAKKYERRIKRTLLHLVNNLPVSYLSACDFRNQTPLLMAAAKNDHELVQALLLKGVDVDCQDTLGRTALHTAVMAGADDCFQMLLRAGANPTLKTSTGKNIAIAIAELGRGTMFECLLQNKAWRLDEEDAQRAYEIAQNGQAEYKKLRKLYAEEGIKIGGRLGYQKVVEIAAAYR